MATEKNRQSPQARGQDSDKEHGEGNYKASRQYNDATRQFVKSGRVEEAAENAKPRGPKEQEEMRKAEQAGRGKSKGEDPQLYKGSRKSGNKSA